jgi:small subunit ribosomal protein S4
MKVGPKYKICRRLGDNVFAQCQTQKFRIARSKKQGTKKFSRKPRTEYGTQLLEKQKVRYSYYINEKQLSNYVKKARGTKKTPPTDTLYELLESRLDNIVYRAGFIPTRSFARQIVSHGHVLVNGKRVTIPSYHVKSGDVVSIRPESRGNHIFSTLNEKLKDVIIPNWFILDKKKGEVTIKAKPSKEGVGNESLDFSSVMEFYSRV